MLDLNQSYGNHSHVRAGALFSCHPTSQPPTQCWKPEIPPNTVHPTELFCLGLSASKSGRRRQRPGHGGDATPRSMFWIHALGLRRSAVVYRMLYWMEKGVDPTPWAPSGLQKARPAANVN